MYISRLRLHNIRCFKNLDLTFDLSGKPFSWNIVLGDNASGKSTMLRSIALGLCDESSAAGLLKEFEEGYIRRGEPRGQITIELRESLQNKKIYSIKTVLERVIKDGPERVRQRTTPGPPSKFPWQRIFLCGYGAARGTSGTGDVAGYSNINAVYNMFNYNEGLQNPELAIRRNVRKKKRLYSILSNIMGLKARDPIKLQSRGVTVDGPWGPEMPLRDLADGYKSTFLWVTDLFGWALSHQSKIRDVRDISGIVLIDEIEQHVHAKWQHKLIPILRAQFPKIQFITSTHSPIIASSVGQLKEKDHDKLILLELQNDMTVRARSIKPMRGFWVEEILASEAFLYVTGSDEETEAVLEEASILAGKKRRTASEQQRYKILKATISKVLHPPGRTLIEREINAEHRVILRNEAKRLETRHFKTSQGK